jgi:hypothetical protein
MVSVAILGIFAAAVVWRPILIAHELIDEWLAKQRKLLKDVKSNDYKTSRDEIPGADADTKKDTKHGKSMMFSKYASPAFLGFWLIVLVWTGVRLILNLK